MDFYEDDNGLMEKVKNGDKSAYEALVLKHRANAVNFAYNIIFDSYEAEDIVQECFAKVYVNRMSHKPLTAFKTYLFTVIRNSCIDFLRRNKKSREVYYDDISDVPNNITPEDSIIKTERINTIFKSFDSLSDDYKTALYLFAVDEMNYSEIAKIMRKSIPQVKIIIHRARKKLKVLCKGDDIFEK